MMRIPFINKDFGAESEQVALFRALKESATAQTRFYIEQERKFYAAIAMHFNLNGDVSINKFVLGRDIYHTSLIRFFDAINRHRLYECDGVLFCKNRSGVVSELKGTLSNYLQCIGKNVYLEMLNQENRHHGDMSQLQICDLQQMSENFIEDEFDTEMIWQIEAVWSVVMSMNGVCKVLLKEFLLKDETGKSDKEIAIQLHYNNVLSVKNQRSRCMKMFKSAITKKMAANGR